MTQMRDDSRRVACTPCHLDAFEVAHIVAADIVGPSHTHTQGLWRPVSSEARPGNGIQQGPVDKPGQVVPWIAMEGTGASDTARWMNFQMRGVSDTHC